MASKIKADKNVLESILKTNEKQIDKLVEIILKNTKKKKNNILILGLAFKPGTDDIRESPSIKLINMLLKLKKIDIEVFDPVAIENTKKIFKDSIKYSTDFLKSTQKSDIVVIMTKWDIFKKIEKIVVEDFNTLIVDPRRLLKHNKFKKYIAFGIS